MPGPTLVIDWQEDEQTLLRCYRDEPDAELRTRFHALWLMRRGHRAKEAADLVAVDVRTVRTWLAWYRQGGVSAIRRHRHGGRQGRTPFLTPEQCAQLVAQSAQGTFTTVADVVAWVHQQFGVTYTWWGMRSLLIRLKITPKVPRPLAAKASLDTQEGWKKGAS